MRADIIGCGKGKNRPGKKELRNVEMKKISTFLISAILGIGMLQAPAVAAETPGDSLVYVVDTSNSMNTEDQGRYLPEAVKLGFDLAPQDSRVGLVTFNDKAPYVSGMADPSSAEQRQTLKTVIDSAKYNGSTNFAAGLEEGFIRNSH